MSKREITTAEELDTLPKRSVILDRDGDAWQKFGGEWCCTDPGMEPFTSAEVAREFLPAHVLHEGDK